MESEIVTWFATLASLSLTLLILKELVRIIREMGQLTNKVASLISITYEASHNPDMETKIPKLDDIEP